MVLADQGVLDQRSALWQSALCRPPITLARTMAEATDETEAARALLAAKDFSNLAAMLVPDGVPSEFLIDELSFELVAPILTHHAAAPAATTRCMQALATAANPREAYALLMEAFSTHPSAPCQLLVLGALPAVLRRITRKRSEFVAACLGSLSRRFVAAWPGQEWDDEAEDEGAPPPPPSRRLLDALVACVPTPAELAEGDRSRLRGDERLCVGFLLRLLAVAARRDAGGGGGRRRGARRAHRLRRRARRGGGGGGGARARGRGRRRRQRRRRRRRRGGGARALGSDGRGALPPRRRCGRRDRGGRRRRHRVEREGGAARGGVGARRRGATGAGVRARSAAAPGPWRARAARARVGGVGRRGGRRR